MNTEDLRYPIGNFEFPGKLTADERRRAVEDISKAPENLRQAIAGLSEKQLDTPYRPDGWTVRQVVHHLPDSHSNSYTRLKLALTEEKPTIRPYDEALWAELPDVTAPVEMSLALLETLHTRWVYLFNRITEDDWQRLFHHPEVGEVRVDELAAWYSWHGRHHIAHITSLRERKGW